MSYFSATVNNSHVKNCGNDHDDQIEAKFRWTFPYQLPLLVNQKWTISVKKAFITERIVNVKKDNDFIFAIMWSTIERKHMNLADTVGCIKSVPQLV